MSEPVEWYFYDRIKMEAAGPLNTQQMMSKIAAGELRVDDYVWSQQFDEARWRRLYEIEDFRISLVATPKIPVPKRSRGMVSRKLLSQIKFDQQHGEYAAYIFRRFPRVPLTGEAIIHNGRSYRKGVCVDISETGLFVKLDDLHAFQKGEEVTLVVKSSELGMFTTAGVVTRLLVEGEFLAFCGFYFLRLNPNTRRKLARYVISQLETAEESQAA